MTSDKNKVKLTENLLREIEEMNDCICDSSDLFKNYTVREAQEMLKRTCVISNIDFDQKKEEIQKMIKSAGKADKVLKDKENLYVVLNASQNPKEFASKLNMKKLGAKFLMCTPLS